MSKITRSVAGSSLGLTNRQETIAARGLIVGAEGRQRTVGSPNHAAIFEDFLGSVLPSSLLYPKGGAGTIAISSSPLDGVATMTSAYAGVVNTDAVCINGGAHNFSPTPNSPVIACECHIEAPTVPAGGYIFFGFVDNLTSLPPFTALDPNNILPHTPNAAGLIYDTALGTVALHQVAVNNSVAQPANNTFKGIIAGQPVCLRVELHTEYDASGTTGVRMVTYANGKRFGATLHNAIQPGTPLTFALIASTTSGTTAQVLYCDYIGAASIRKLDL